MKVNPIQTQPVQQQVNFKSRLPKVSYVSKRVNDDFWGEFTNNCIKENKLEELKDLLHTLTSNFDKNVLALRKQSGLFTEDNGNRVKYDSYTFTLHNSEDKFDYHTQLSKEVGVQNIYNDIAGTVLKKRDLYNGVSAENNETTTTVLLRMLKEIVTPNTECNKAIYKDNDNAAEHFLKDFRA